MTTPELQNTEQQALALFQKIDTLIQYAKKHLKTAVDLAMVYTYFEIGREIIEDEQKGRFVACVSVSERMWYLGKPKL